MIAHLQVVQWLGLLIVCGVLGDLVACELPTYLRRRRAQRRGEPPLP